MCLIKTNVPNYFRFVFNKQHCLLNVHPKGPKVKIKVSHNPAKVVKVRQRKRRLKKPERERLTRNYIFFSRLGSAFFFFLQSSDPNLLIGFLVESDPYTNYAYKMIL